MTKHFNKSTIKTFIKRSMMACLSLCFPLSILTTSLFTTPLHAQEYVDENAVVENVPVQNVPASSFTPPPAVTPVDCADTIPICRPPLSFIFDKTFSAVVGAEALISGLHIYSLLDDNFLPSTQGSTEGTMIFGRLGKLVLENFFFNMASVTQHEIFGHGARGREFHFETLRFRVNFWGGGSTLFVHRDFLNLSPSEKMAYVTGGVESNYILAKQLRTQWLDTKFIDEREGHLYILTAMDQASYILKTHRRYPNRRFGGRRFFPAGIIDDGNDIRNYVNQVNRWHRRHVLSLSDLRRYVLLDFLDPYFYFSAFSLGNYLYDGSQGFEYPMLNFGNVQYLPGFRLILAPYAPEYQFINYIRALDQIFQVTLRYSNLANKQAYGLTFEALRLWSSELLNFDGRLDIWDQPKMNTRYFRRSAENKWGAAASVMARYKVNNCLELKAQVGYKTTGYVPGEELRHTPILRAGFALHM